jgi:hypothetical protein
MAEVFSPKARIQSSLLPVSLHLIMTSQMVATIPINSSTLFAISEP